jgi:branched-chain amino acid transport system substrate-binding protein
MKKRYLVGGLVLLAVIAIVIVVVKSRRSEPSNTVRVGAILPMTGTSANYGELMSRGISVAADEFNASRAKDSPSLDVVIEDSKSTPRDGLSAMQKLIQIDKVAAVMPALSGVVLACVPIAESNHVVLLNCPANSPKLRGAGSFVFNITILSDQESEYLADFAFNKMGAKSAAIAFVNNEYGRSYGDSFAKKYTAVGGVIKLSEGHEQGATDFRTTIEKFRSANVDLVFLATYYAEGALFLKQSKELGFKSKWLSNSSMETPDFLKIAGDAGEGLVFSQPGFDADSSNELTKKFVAEYRKRYGINPDFWSAQYYDGTRLLGAAVASGARTGDEIRAYLKNLKGFPGLTGPIEFDEKGGVTRTVRFKTVKNGTFQYLME